MIWNRLLPAVALLALAGTVSPALASDQNGTAADQWKEEHTAGTTLNGAIDAGPLLATANITRGGGPLNTINGSLAAAGNANLDADLFQISITDPTSFSATVGGSTDSILSLFDATGHGVAFNDDRTDSVSSHGAKITNLLTGTLTPGVYYLAISRTDGNQNANIQYMRPLDASSNLMFPGSPSFTAPVDATRRAEYGPILPTSVLSGWETFAGGFTPFNFNYTITLTGAGYGTTPAPGAAALLGLAGIAAARRRRS